MKRCWMVSDRSDQRAYPVDVTLYETEDDALEAVKLMYGREYNRLDPFFFWVFVVPMNILNKTMFRKPQI